MIEVAIPSIINLANTSYVVISKDTERFVNQIHDQKEELRSSTELLTAERPIASRILVRALLAILVVILRSRKRSSLQVNENGLRLILTLHQGAVCLQRYPRWSRRWYLVNDQDEREEDGSYHWDTVKSLLLWGFAQERRNKFLARIGCIWFSMEAVRPESNTAWITRNLDVIYELFGDTLVVFQ